MEDPQIADLMDLVKDNSNDKENPIDVLEEAPAPSGENGENSTKKSRKPPTRRGGNTRSRGSRAAKSADGDEPASEERLVVKKKPKKGKNENRGGAIINHDNCDACSDGGELLCCDGCPRSFHFECLDPPMVPEDIGDDEKWYCNVCKMRLGLSDKPPIATSSVMKQIFDWIPAQNPTVFMLPDVLRKMSPENLRAQEVQKYDVSYLMRNPENVNLRYAALPREATRGAKRNMPVCSVCGVEEPDHLVMCTFTDCNNAVHSYCLSSPDQATENWRCPEHVGVANVEKTAPPPPVVTSPPAPVEVVEPSPSRAMRSSDNVDVVAVEPIVQEPEQVVKRPRKRRAKKADTLTKEQEMAQELEIQHRQYLDMSRVHYEQNLHKFRHLPSDEQEKQMSEVEEEVKRLYTLALGQNSMNASVATPMIVGPQVMHQLGDLFTQFLAWQRLMQLVDVVPSNVVQKINDKSEVEIARKKRNRDAVIDDDRSSNDNEKSARGTDRHNYDREKDDSFPPPPKRQRLDENSRSSGSGKSEARRSELNADPSVENRASEPMDIDEVPQENGSALDDVLGHDSFGFDDHHNELFGDERIHDGEMDDLVRDDDAAPEVRDEQGGEEAAPPTPREEGEPQTPRTTVPDRYDPGTPETPRDVPAATPTKYTPGKYALKPAQALPRAVISGDGIWGEHFRFELHQFPTGFLIGRKNPNVDLDMSEFTDVRTVSHRHCMFVYNRKLGQFQIENYGRNGTRLNGELFGKSGNARRNLSDGDTIEVGKVAIKFQLLPSDDDDKTKKS